MIFFTFRILIAQDISYAMLCIRKVNKTIEYMLFTAVEIIWNQSVLFFVDLSRFQ